jgi:hypothetical protein
MLTGGRSTTRRRSLDHIRREGLERRQRRHDQGHLRPHQSGNRALARRLRRLLEPRVRCPFPT